MAHNPAWHAEYRRLENEAAAASSALSTARKNLDRKRPPANAQATYDAALVKARETGVARWEFEMTGATIVDSATLESREWFTSLRRV